MNKTNISAKVVGALRTIATVAIFAVAFTVVALPHSASAAQCNNNAEFNEGDLGAIGVSAEQFCADKGGIKPAASSGSNGIAYDTTTGTPCALKSSSGDTSTNCIMRDINAVINFLAVGVGLIVTVMIVVAAIRYVTARDNPQTVQAAKTMIWNALIALVAFVFIYSFIQWLVPGGVF